MSSLRKICDIAVETILKPSGYVRLERGLYAKSDDRSVWRALWITFTKVRDRIAVQPNMSIFCPAASEIVDEGLREAYGPEAGKVNSTLGSPLVIRPLYDCVREYCGADRMSFSYDISDASSAENMAALIVGDFLGAEPHYFAGPLSMRELFDRITATPFDSGTGASMYAMALAYILDRKLPIGEIDVLARLWPCQMTDEFAVYMKHRIAAGC